MSAWTPSLLESFKLAPQFFVLSALAGTFGFALVIAAAILALKAPRAGIVIALLALFMGLGAMASGALGAALTAQRTELALTMPGLSQADTARLREASAAEQGHVLMFGLAAGGLPAAAALALAVVSFQRRRRSPRP